MYGECMDREFDKDIAEHVEQYGYHEGGHYSAGIAIFLLVERITVDHVKQCLNVQGTIQISFHKHKMQQSHNGDSWDWESGLLGVGG